jgi:hypothetical protein
MRLGVCTLAVAALASSTFAQTTIPPTPAAAAAMAAAPPPSATTVRLGRARTIFVTHTEDDFNVYLQAAFMKKDVPLTIVTKDEAADFILTPSKVQIQVQSGASKVARCLFAYCAGIDDSGNTSVQLTRGDEVVWSYSVNKGRGQKNMQSLAEAVAVHLKDDYLKKQR